MEKKLDERLIETAKFNDISKPLVENKNDILININDVIKDFNIENIYRLREYILFGALCTEYADLAYVPQTKGLKNFLKEFEDQIVIDLGSGANLYGYLIADLAKAKSYIATDDCYSQLSLFNRKFEKIFLTIAEDIKIDQYLSELPRHKYNSTKMGFILTDMLTLLKEIPDNSVSIFCSGIDHYVIPDQSHRDDIAKEISRVLHPKGAYIGETFGGHIRPVDYNRELIHGIEESGSIRLIKIPEINMGTSLIKYTKK